MVNLIQGKLQLFLALVVVFLFFSACFVIFNYPLDYDEAFNLQVPVSLSKSLVYKTTYHPQYIFNSLITTGFPLHYLQAIFFVLGGVNFVSVRLFTCIIFLAFLSIVYILNKRFDVVIYLVSLFFISPLFQYIYSSYLGQLFSVALFILSFFVLRKKQTDGWVILSSFLFSLSFHTKIIAIFFLPALLFELKSFRSIVLFFACLINFILGEYLLIVFYSYFLEYRTISGFFSFVIDNLLRNINYSSGLSSSNTLLQIPSLNSVKFQLEEIQGFGLTNINMISLLLMPLVFLFKRKTFVKYFFPFWGYLHIFGSSYLNPRHLSMFWLFFIVFFVKEYPKFSRFLFVALVIINIGLFAFQFQEFKDRFNKNKMVLTDQLTVAHKIRTVNGTILTDGWWQLPEISFLSGKNFSDIYQMDGFNSQNAYYFVSNFRMGNEIPSLDQNCSHQIFCEKGYLFCITDKISTVSGKTYKNIEEFCQKQLD